MDYIEKLYTGTRLKPLHPYFCGQRRNAPDHRFGPTDRPHFWLMYLKEGRGTFRMNGYTHPLAPGDMYIAYPHRSIWYRAAPGSVWSLYWIALDEEGIQPYLDMMHITEDHPLCHSQAPLTTEHLFETLLAQFPENTVAANLACSGLILQLLSDFVDSNTPPAANRDHIDEAIFFLSNHSSEPINIEDCANAIGLNKSYLIRLFHAKTGVTPHVWLNKYRFDRAASLLRETSMTISEIARAVGIQDPLYFSRCFSRKFGCSPKEYRHKRHGDIP